MILVIGAAMYATPFTRFGKVYLTSYMSSIENKDPAEYKAVVFTGGEDVSPLLYDEPISPKTGAINFKRDIRERAIFKWAVNAKLPLLGICRGAQLLCALSGGKLIQHVDGHTSSHNMHASNVEYPMVVSSTHHQMMYPWALPKEDYTMLGWAYTGKNYHSIPAGPQSPFSGRQAGGFRDPEVVKFHKTNALATQFHPEIMGTNSKGYQWYQELVAEHLNA